MAKITKPEEAPVDLDSLVAGGEAFEMLLGKINLKKQLEGLKAEIQKTKSPSKKDELIKKLKFIQGLVKSDLSPKEAYIIHNMPVAPPIIRPAMIMGNNSIKYADVNSLYRDHLLVNEPLKETRIYQPNNLLVPERRGLYEGAKAVFGLGEAIAGSSRGHNLRGYIKQISGNLGPKGGLFHSKLLSKKLDFSGRATIYAEPNLGFNEAAIPEDMLWTTYEFHIIRDLVKQGYDYVSAKKAVEARNSAAKASFSKLIKQIPVLLNRAPTLMRTNITAHFPVPIKGKTIGLNPLHLPMYAADYDGDAFTIQIPMTPGAIDEARSKLLPEHHIHDYRKGMGSSIMAPGHEAIIGSMHMTDPDSTQKTMHFKTEEEALKALKNGSIEENTPIIIG